MNSLDWVLLAVGLVTALYWYLTRHHDYWKTVGVPSLPGALPGVGHMWDAFVLKASAPWYFCDLYWQNPNQPAVGVYDFRKPALLLRNLDLIQDVLVKEFSSFHDNAVSVDESLDLHISRNPFILKGDRWKSLRQKLNPAFSPVKVKAMFPLIQRVCQEFSSYIDSRADQDININHVAALFSSEVVAKCAFGVDGNAFPADGEGEFYRTARKIWDNSTYNPLVILLTLYFPIVNKILRRSFVPEEVKIFLIGLVTQSEDYRIKNPDKVPEDYLQYLLNLKKKDPEFTIDDVVAQSLTFFTDGFETSSVVASWILYELTLKPDLQEAVRQKVKSIEAFNYENIISIDLLHRLVKEALRKYGAVFTLVKECTKGHVLQMNGQSYPIRKGQEIIIPVYAIHRDPKYYPDPEKFDPDRFLPDNVQKRHSMSFLGFGGGPRICIGNRFATSMVKIFIAHTLNNYRLVKSDKTVENITISHLGIVPASEEVKMCRFQKL